jgi:hypothetical protein
VLGYLRIALWAIGLSVWAVFQWWAGNALYSLFNYHLERRFGVKEAEVIASLSTYTVPALLIGVLLYAFFKLAVNYGKQAAVTHPASSAFPAQPVAPSHAEPTLTTALTDERTVMTMNDVFRQMEKSEWGEHAKTEATRRGDTTIHTQEYIDEFCRAARSGRVAVRGRLNDEGFHVLIPHEVWLSCTLDFNTSARRQPGRTAPIIPGASLIPIYTDLRAAGSDVLMTWPAKELSASEMNSQSLARVKERLQGETHSSTPLLKISSREDGQYFKTKSENLYNTRRILKLKLENISGEHAVSQIKVTLLSIEPQSDYVGPWTLASGLTLAAGDHNFIPFVSFGEADSAANYSTSRYDRSDSFYVFLTNDSNQPSGPKETPQYFHVRATGIGTAPCEYRGKVWVDKSDGRLRIADADDRPDFSAQSAGTGLKQQLLDNLERNRQARAAASAEPTFKEVHDDFSRIMIEHEKEEGKTDIRLRFLPDGDQPATKALLVLCLLYRRLRSQKLSVKFANAEVAWLCAHAPNASGTSITRNQIYLHVIMGGTVDYGKEAIENGLSNPHRSSLRRILRVDETGRGICAINRARYDPPSIGGWNAKADAPSPR